MTPEELFHRDAGSRPDLEVGVAKDLILVGSVPYDTARKSSRRSAPISARIWRQCPMEK